MAGAPRFDPSFSPPSLLRGPHLQSILPSLPPLHGLIRRRARALLQNTRELILDCGQGVRLQALHTPSAQPRGRLALLLHGWEGSADSSNLLSLGALLLQRGYAVLRLNLRDHGPTHQLNRELFHSCRLPEVVGAVRAVAVQFDERLFLGGFSLGGNFLLRVAADFGAPAERVAVVAAVSPVLEPEHTLAALEHGWLMYRRHFIRLWSCSLRAKARAWPGEYNFSAMLRRPDLRRMTAELVRRCTDFPDLAHYLSGYAVTGARLAHLRVPARVLLAADDPIIPLDDLEQVARSPELTITCTRYGGHCGFIDGFLGPNFADRFVLGEFERRE